MNVVKLRSTDKHSRDVGQKAAYLGELMRLGFQVPDGFVVTNEAFEKFLVFNGIDEKLRDFFGSIDWNNKQGVLEKSKEIMGSIIAGQLPSYIEKSVQDEYEELSIGSEARGLGGMALDLIKAGRTPAFCSVRTSILSNSEFSFAGQSDSFLNVNGRVMLFDCIKKCWASLFSISGLYYRKHAGLSELPKAGVVVHKMVNSEKAAYLMTSHPYIENTMLLESTWGLGETLGLGEVVPDSYLIDYSGSILDKKVGKKIIYRRKHELSGRTNNEFVSNDRVNAEVLSQDDIARFFEISRKALSGLGKDFLLELGIEKGRLHVLQAKPLHTKSASPEYTQPRNKREIASGLAVSRGLVQDEIIRDGSEDKKGILLIKESRPSFMNSLSSISGVISENGGFASHASIIAREFSLPFVSSVSDAYNNMTGGDVVILDGFAGKVYSPEEVPVPQVIREESIEHSEYGGGPNASVQDFDSLTATEIKTSHTPSSHPNTDGIGVVMGELLAGPESPYLLAENAPEELTERIKQKLGKVAKSVYPKPVWYKLIDIKTGEVGDSVLVERNPMLGWHGIRRSLDQPVLIQCELGAIRRLAEEGLNNICIMLPFVTRPEELREFKAYLDFPAKLGISIESPASVFSIEDFCKEGIDFVSIASNELSQHILAIDKENANTSRHYSESRPAVLNAIKHVIDCCRKHGVHVSAYGDATDNAEFASRLVEFGVNSLSVSHSSLDEIRKAIIRTEKKLLLGLLRRK